jgi:hypothetical protein
MQSLKEGDLCHTRAAPDAKEIKQDNLALAIQSASLTIVPFLNFQERSLTSNHFSVDAVNLFRLAISPDVFIIFIIVVSKPRALRQIHLKGAKLIKVRIPNDIVPAYLTFQVM